MPIVKNYRFDKQKTSEKSISIRWYGPVLSRDKQIVKIELGIRLTQVEIGLKNLSSAYDSQKSERIRLQSSGIHSASKYKTQYRNLCELTTKSWPATCSTQGAV